MEPITRQELFLAAASGENVELPEPITREEMYLKAIVEAGGGGASDFNKFCDNIDIDYAFDADTNANYTVIRIYRDKLDGTKQYPFVYAPNGAEPCQKSTYEISHEDGWFLAINSGVFDTSAHTAIGMLVQNGKVLQNTPDESNKNRPLTIDEDGNLAEVAYNADATTLVNNGVVSAVCGFMAIVKNYEAVPSSEWNNIAHYTQNAQRQIIGQFGNGDYAIITCEGRNFGNSDGWTIAEAQQICLKHGLKFAYNLDGGGSTETMLGLKHFNQIYEGTTGRKVPTFIVFNGASSFTPPTPIVKKLSAISVTKTQTQYDVGDTLNIDDIVVIAYYTDGTNQNVTSSATISTSQVDMATAGTYPIAISYTEGEITKTTSISISVDSTVDDYTFHINQSAIMQSNPQRLVISPDYRRATVYTQTPNEMPLYEMVEGTLRGYMIPIPPSATKVTATVASGYIPALRLVTSDLATDIDVGWSSSNVASRLFEADTVEYLAVNVKSSSNSEIPSDVDTSSWTIVFE